MKFSVTVHLTIISGALLNKVASTATKGQNKSKEPYAKKMNELGSALSAKRGQNTTKKPKAKKIKGSGSGLVTAVVRARFFRFIIET
jgi:hypothetical protein